MELTPKLLTDDVDFRIAMRGYDKDEVDDFLERVAMAVGQLQEQLATAVDRARKAEARLQQAQAGAVRAEPSTEAAAAAPERSVADEAEVEDLNEELRRTLVLAQRTADAAIREAREEAARITAEAEEAGRHTIQSSEAESQRASDEAKGRLVAELEELEGIRVSLQADINLLERHLGEHRAKVRETVQVLRRLVDDPQSFQVQPTPDLSGAAVPAAPEPVVEEPRLEPAEELTEPEATPEPEADTPSATLGREPGEAAAAAPEAGHDPEPGSGRDLRSRFSSPSTSSGLAQRMPADPGPEGGSGGVAPQARLAAGPGGPSSTAVLGTERRTTAPIAGAPRPAARATEGQGLDLRVATDRSGAALGAPTIGGATRAAESSGHRLGGLFADEGSWRQDGPPRGDQGPSTQPIAAARIEDEPDDAFLAELRKAMTDDEPLGPRDGVESVPFATPEAPPRTRFRRER